MVANRNLTQHSTHQPDPTQSMIDLFIDCVPPTITAQQKGVRVAQRNGKMAPFFFKKTEVVEAEAAYIKWLLPYAPKTGIHYPEGPVRLEVTFINPWTSELGKRRWNDALPIYVPKPTRPDTDNSLKLLKDTMTALKFWTDDSQVAEELTRKGWGDRHGIHIKVSSVLTHYSTPAPEVVL